MLSDQRSWTLKQQLGSYAVIYLPSRHWEMMILPPLSALGTGVLWTHLKICFVCYNTVGFMNASPISFQRLKSCLHSSGRSWKLVVPFWLYGAVPGIEVYSENVPQPFLSILMCYFLSHPMCKSHSISFCISLRGNCSIGSRIFSAFVEGGRFRSLLCFHLGLEYALGGMTLKHMLYIALQSSSGGLSISYP